MKKKIERFLLFDCGLLKQRYKYKSKTFLKFYFKDISTLKINKTQVVYMADGKISPGGLSDRLHGIISLYKFCKDKSIDFKANFNHPFMLHDYFEPASYDWDIPIDSISYNLSETGILPIFCVFKKYNISIEDEAKFQYKTLEQFVKQKRSKQLHIYTNAHFANTGAEYSMLFHELFKPTIQLQEAINRNKEKIGSEYIAIVLRFQNLFNDFKEAHFPALPTDKRAELINKCINKITEIYSIQNKKILVTSDSITFLHEADKLDFVYTIPGRVVHMAYSPEKDYNIHLKSFIDIMMVSEADKIFLLVTGDMYHSGFAQSAAFINNKEYEEIIF